MGIFETESNTFVISEMMNMKFNKLTIHILFYIVLYHIVFEIFSSYYIQLGFEIGDVIFTPIGRIFRKLILHEVNIRMYIYYGDFYIFLFNLAISSILFFYFSSYIDVTVKNTLL